MEKEILKHLKKRCKNFLFIDKRGLINELMKFKGNKIVFTSGVFNKLHPGHNDFFKRIKKVFGKRIVLIISIDSDKFALSSKRKRVENLYLRAAKIFDICELISFYKVILVTRNSKQGLFNKIRIIQPNIVTFSLARKEKVKSHRKKLKRIVSNWGGRVHIIRNFTPINTSGLS